MSCRAISKWLKESLSGTRACVVVTNHQRRDAREDRRGIREFQTTDLDAGLPVLWNIGAIAASGHPSAANLICRILLASASIPAAFPPVLFDVTANGKSYQEMHVDGGAVSQAFLIPPSLDVRIAQEKSGFRREVAIPA
jgi:hypothetical protein